MSRRSSRRNYNEASGAFTEEEADDRNQEASNDIGDEEDEIDDEQEVTRCVCGNDDLNPDTINENVVSLLSAEYLIKIDQGLFIQCDKCSVWQHGYCVGLFTNDDVPDKYWCELCKPDLHIFIHETPDLNRTLYKPLNEKRKKLVAESEKLGKRKFTRKDRRSYDYDEQLQKALRESAKESGIKLDESKKNEKSNKSSSKEPKSGDEEEKVSSKEEKEESDGAKEPPEEPAEAADEEGEAEAEEEEENTEVKKELKKKPMKRVKRKDNRGKSKKQKADGSDGDDKSSLTKEELINQSSKPRFVNDKSSIYELRKRISAILEWLSRSQLELEEEKSAKANITQETDILNSYDENLRLMQSLTVKILEWEEKYGKYAP